MEVKPQVRTMSLMSGVVSRCMSERELGWLTLPGIIVTVIVPIVVVALGLAVVVTIVAVIITVISAVIAIIVVVVVVVVVVVIAVVVVVVVPVIVVIIAVVIPVVIPIVVPVAAGTSAVAAAAGVAVLADAVLALGSDGADVEALVGAEALDLELVLLAVVVVAAEVDLAAAVQLGNGAADVAALTRCLVEVELDASAGHHDHGRDGQEGGLVVHRCGREGLD